MADRAGDLRSLAALPAAGTPTVTIDLVHMADVPALDPRTWLRRRPGLPCTVAIDILDEDHSLRLAMRRLATDRAAPRQPRPTPAVATGAAHHSIEGMIEDYRALIDEVRELADPRRRRCRRIFSPTAARRCGHSSPIWA